MCDLVPGLVDYRYSLGCFFCLAISAVSLLIYIFFNKKRLFWKTAWVFAEAFLGGVALLWFVRAGQAVPLLNHVVVTGLVLGLGALFVAVWLRLMACSEHDTEPRSHGGVIGTLLFFLFRVRDREVAFQLREGALRHKKLFDDMITGVAVHALVRDEKGVPVDCRFLEVNDAFERLTGLRAAAVVGKTVQSAIPDIESEWIERYVRVSVTGVSDQFEMYFASLGKWFSVRLFSSGPDRVAAVFEDITDRKKTMDALAAMMLRMRQQQKALLAIANSQGPDLGDLAARITPAAAAGMDVLRVSVWLGSREDGRLVCLDLFEADHGRHVRGMEIPAERYPRYFEALASDRVVAAGDAWNDPRTGEFRDRHLQPLGIGARIDAAVRLSGRMVAMISFEHVGPARVWQPDEVRFAVEVADQIEYAFLGVENRRNEAFLREKTGELEKERVNLQAIFDAVPVGMLLVNKDGVVVRANAAAARFAGKDIALLPGEPFGAVLCCRQALEGGGCGKGETCVDCPVRRTFLRVIMTGEALPGLEIRKEFLRGNAPRTGWLELTAGPIVIDGERHALLAVSDMSLRKRSEEALRKAKEAAESADKVKSEFLSSMSHETRTPMNAILGFTQLLQNTDLNVKQREYTDAVMLSGKMLMQVIRDVLDISRLAAGKVALENIDFQLRPLVGEVMAAMKAEAEGREILFIEDVSADVPDELVGDPTRLMQVLVNVVGNAVKFTERGSIVLRVRRMLWEVPGRLMLAIEVEDSGIGIAPEKLPKIFDPFVQADMSTTRPYGGTGLGLALCRSIVHAMGGRISAISTPGKGSLFMFTAVFSIRVAGGDAAASPETEAEEIDLKGVRVLVVEDNLPNQELIKELCALIGCEAVFAPDGKAAVDRLREGPFDLCLMDVQMPIMGGEEATRIIRSTITRTMPIIALTGAAMPGDRQRLLTSGMTDYLSKPVSLQRLRAMIALYAKKKGQS